MFDSDDESEDIKWEHRGVLLWRVLIKVNSALKTLCKYCLWRGKLTSIYSAIMYIIVDVCYATASSNPWYSIQES